MLWGKKRKNLVLKNYWNNQKIIDIKIKIEIN